MDTEPVQTLAGIGPARAAEFSKIGMETVEDLLTMAPVRYEDRRRFTLLAELHELPPGTKATLRVRVISARLIRTRRRGFSMVRAVVTDGESEQAVVWFNQPYLARHLAGEREMVLYGDLKPARGRGRPSQLENPEIELLPAGDSSEAAIHMGRIVPVYRRIGTLSGRRLRRLLHDAVGTLPAEIPDPLPADLRRQHGFPGRAEALRSLHFPAGDVDTGALAAFRTPSQRRLIFEELYLLLAALEMKKARRRRTRRPVSYDNPDPLRLGLARRLPFTLTGDQRRALATIAEDLGGTAPMARLLQGDVGCGKTVVAVLSMLVAAESGHQAALMAPTEVLAEQHHRSLRSLLEPEGHEIALLTGKLAAAGSRAIKERLARGDLRLVVGTHALIQDDVKFRRLALVVVDEQHRFGVAQRESLTRKGGRPDLLVMTATPIPRTLALTRYGDLEAVEIRERPPGRPAVSTTVHPRSRRREAWRFVHSQVSRGRQAYVVYPLVSETEKLDLADATAAHGELSAGPLADLDVGLVHGRMEVEKREAVMRRFAAGECQVLVATTVVEVGVDVANASVLVVEHAERFGLAQLHQLRGRVGRGAHPSHCILLHEPRLTTEAGRRLEVIARTDDGFAIAREDLALRGPGELLGLRQHGPVDLRLADLVRDETILEDARTAVAAADGAAGHRAQRAALRRWGRRMGLAEAG
jgi:ATP-dependent DNA helicase RecG